MNDKPTYEDLENKIRSLEKKLDKGRIAERELNIFRRLADTAGYGFGIADVDGNIRYVNKALAVMMGESSPRAAIGKHVSEYYPESVRSEMMKKILPLVAKKGQWVGDIPLLSMKEKLTHTLQNIFLVQSEDGSPPVMANLLIDITEQKRMDQALRETLEFMKKVVSESPIGILIYDRNGQCIDANSAIVEIVGAASREQLLAQNFHRIGSWKKAGLCEIAQSALDENVKKRVELDLRSTFGKELTLDCHIVPFESEGQRHLLLMINDMTERKKTRDQLQRSEKMEAIGMLAGRVAHDLNNILSALVGYPSLLLTQLPESSPMRKAILTIEESGKKAAAIVQDLLTFARRVVTATEVFNLNDVIANYLDSPEHKRRIREHAAIRFDHHLAEDLLNMIGSPSHLHNAMMNLITNAIEAQPDGGRIEISTRNQYIDKPVNGYDPLKEGDYVVLRVTDIGKGIPQEHLGKIFEPFYTTKVMGRSGTGLGLPIVWGTVKDHLGYIHVESREGRGTTFELFFPATREQIALRKSPPAMNYYRGTGEKILVVDDVLQQREIATVLLTSLGYSVETVSSGEDAVEYLSRERVDLVVLDMIMDPGWDGLETYQKIREFLPNQKTILVSGFSESERVLEAQRLGAGTYVGKPFTVEKIGTVIRNELKR